MPSDPDSLFQIQPLFSADLSWVKKLLIENWGSEQIVSRSVLVHVPDYPGYIAKMAGERMGLITYNIVDTQCQILTLNSLKENIGVGTALIHRVMQEARQQNCHQAWLITTNDNARAQQFYANRGFQLKCKHPDAVQLSRKLKPEIPLIGQSGIPINDEYEYILDLT